MAPALAPTFAGTAGTRRPAPSAGPRVRPGWPPLARARRRQRRDEARKRQTPKQPGRCRCRTVQPQAIVSVPTKGTLWYQADRSNPPNITLSRHGAPAWHRAGLAVGHQRDLGGVTGAAPRLAGEPGCSGTLLD